MKTTGILSFVSLGLIATAEAAPQKRQDLPVSVAIAEKVVHNIVDESPYIVDSTTLITWTQTLSAEPTVSAVVSSASPTISALSSGNSASSLSAQPTESAV